jgi:hypothetical protein
LPRHNSSTELPSKLPAELLSAPLVWVHRGGLVSLLQPLYDGPYAVLRCDPRSYTIRVGSRDEVVAVSCLKACTAANTTPGSPHRRGRPPGSHPGGPAATKRVLFSDRWSLHLLFRRHHKMVPEPFSYLARRFLLARDRQRHHRCHRHGTRPVNGHRHRGWTSDLFSSQARPDFGGSPVDTCLHPWRRSDQLGVLQQPCTALHKLLYISCYLTPINQCCRTSCCAYFHNSIITITLDTNDF